MDYVTISTLLLWTFHHKSELRTTSSRNLFAQSVMPRYHKPSQHYDYSFTVTFPRWFLFPPPGPCSLIPLQGPSAMIPFLPTQNLSLYLNFPIPNWWELELLKGMIAKIFFNMDKTMHFSNLILRWSCPVLVEVNQSGNFPLEHSKLK